jgi:hypothetical protein
MLGGGFEIMDRIDGTEYRYARELLDGLRALLLDEKAPEPVARYIFRGQGDASWELIPCAFRPGTLLGYESQQFCRVSDGLQRTWDQGNAELTAVMEFLQLADKVGLEIPADHEWLRQWNPFRNRVGHDIGIENWPPQGLYEALALAQHHGVPTRLLDFTYDPLVAAFFAAENSPPKADRIAVWSVDLEAILASDNASRRIEVVTVSRAQNRNLEAQKGLFLLDRYGSLWRNQGPDSPSNGQKIVQKYSLPVGECETLLNLLRKLGVDRAHLMPSFNGVVKELEARRDRQAGRRIPQEGECA